MNVIEVGSREVFMDYIGRLGVEMRRGDGLGIDAFMGFPVVVNDNMPANCMAFGGRFYLIDQPGGGERHDDAAPGPAQHRDVP